MENQQQSVSAQPTPPVLPGAADLFKRTWQVYKARFWTFLGIMLLPALLSLVALIFIIPTATLTFIARNPIFLILSLVIFLPAAIIANLWSQVSLLYAIKERETKTQTEA